MIKKNSIEYAHIYTNSKISQEHRLSLKILSQINKEEGNSSSLVVMIDDYSFPDPSFNYEEFILWLTKEGFRPDLMIRESQLIPSCDEVLKLIKNENLVKEISDYVIAKKYPCSLFIATWYLIRLGYVSSLIFDSSLIARKLINILPLSFKPFEDKALEIINSTHFSEAINQIEYRYFDGRLVS